MKHSHYILPALLYIFIVSFITGCMHAVPKEKIDTIKRIGVVSILGDDLELRDKGFLVTTSKSFSVESWKIDEYVQDLITKELSNRHGITVVKINYDHKYLHKLNLAYDKSSKVSRVLQASVVDQIATIAKENRLDAVIVISYLALSDHRQVLPLIIFRGWASGVILGVAGQINVLDGATIEKIGVTTFSSTDFGEEIDSSYWPPFDGKMEKLGILEKEFKNALKKQLIIKLKYLGFIESDI